MERSFPSLKRSLPPLDNLSCLRNNVIMGYDVPAILADGTCEIRNEFCFGFGNLNIMIALRARTIGCFTQGFMASTLKIDGLPIHDNLACTGFSMVSEGDLQTNSAPAPAHG